MEKLKIGGFFDPIGWKKNMFYFHPIHKKMSETCQKLAFAHPIVVLKSGLKNNWMKKLDCVNRPLEHRYLIDCMRQLYLGPLYYIMVEPIRKKQAKTVLNAFVRIIKRERALTPPPPLGLL